MLRHASHVAESHQENLSPRRSQSDRIDKHLSVASAARTRPQRHLNVRLSADPRRVGSRLRTQHALSVVRGTRG
jgi:hypothetical protein